MTDFIDYFSLPSDEQFVIYSIRRIDLPCILKCHVCCVYSMSSVSKDMHEISHHYSFYINNVDLFEVTPCCDVIMYALFPLPRCASCTVYSMSNVIMADKNLTLFHQYQRYRHKWGTIVFSTPSAII